MQKNCLDRMHGLKISLIREEIVVLHKIERELWLDTFLWELTGHWNERDGPIVGWGGMVTTKHLFLSTSSSGKAFP